MDDLELQVKVSKMLGIAFVLSITGVGGIGSLAAFILGWKALRAIGKAQEKINGRLMAWWCILAGAIGTLTIPFEVIMPALNTLK